MISGTGAKIISGTKLSMQGAVKYVDKETCNQKHGEGLNILFLIYF